MRASGVLGARHNVLLGNVVARVGALGCVLVATLVLARRGGAEVVGAYALLHVLPGLIGTLASCGVPVATPYFLAGSDRDNAHLRTTLVTLAVAGGVAGAAAWMGLAPLFAPLIFSGLSVPLVVLAGLLVLTRLVVITAKACSQGNDDLPASNAIIFLEQLMFLPAYACVSAAGAGEVGAVVGGLLLADAATASLAWTRLLARGFFRAAARPSFSLGRRIASFGLRGQVGGVMSLLNLRLDFILLSVLAGPAVVGVYAIASKFAELTRILGMAFQYVFYPKFARESRLEATQNARRLMLRAGVVSSVAIVPLWVSAGFVIPAFYGSDFAAAVSPARIILVGLVFDGVASVLIAFLYGIGRPGLGSAGIGVGLLTTVVLDLLLIPNYGAVGAAVASAVAYTATAGALYAFFVWVERAGGRRSVGVGASAADDVTDRVDERAPLRIPTRAGRVDRAARQRA